MRLASMMQLICGEMRCRCSMRTVAPALWPHDWRTYSAGLSTFHRRHCWMVSRGIPTLSPSILQSAPVILQLNCSKCTVTHLKYSTLNNGLKWKFSQLKGDNSNIQNILHWTEREQSKYSTEIYLKERSHLRKYLIDSIFV